MISCTLLAKFVRNGAFRGAVNTDSASGAFFRVRCCSVRVRGGDMKLRLRLHSWRRRCGGRWRGGSMRLSAAPPGRGRRLTGELARLVPRGGPNQRSDRRRHPAAGPRLPSRSAFAESRIPPPHHLPPLHHRPLFAFRPVRERIGPNLLTDTTFCPVREHRRPILLTGTALRFDPRREAFLPNWRSTSRYVD